MSAHSYLTGRTTAVPPPSAARRWGLLAAVFLALPVAIAPGADRGFDVAFEEWQSAMAEPVDWEPLSIVEVTSERGPVEPLADGSVPVLPSGRNPRRYVVKTKTVLPAITAFRLEVFPGAAGSHSGAVIAEFRAASGAALVFGRASAGSARNGFGPDRAIDGDLKTGWAPAAPFEGPQAAVFELKSSDAVPAGAVHTFILTVNGGAGLARFRIAATGRRPPVRELPAPLRAALALEPSERTPGQRAALRAFFVALHAAEKAAPGGR